MPEVDRLLGGEYALVGNWSLGQICNHLTDSITFSVEGYPALAPWILRRTIGPVIFRRILRKGTFPSGLTLPKKYQPKPGLDARAEAEALRAALQYYAGYTGPVKEHPLAGRITRSQWDQFHNIHCAHHLSFALPSATS